MVWLVGSLLARDAPEIGKCECERTNKPNVGRDEAAAAGSNLSVEQPGLGQTHGGRGEGISEIDSGCAGAVKPNVLCPLHAFYVDARVSPLIKKRGEGGGVGSRVRLENRKSCVRRGAGALIYIFLFLLQPIRYERVLFISYCVVVIRA